MAVKKVNSGLTPDKSKRESMIEQFVNAVMLNGYTLKDAYLMTHPQTKSNNDSLRKIAWDYANQTDVKARMDELRDELKAKAAAFRDRLVEYHINEIDACVRNEGSLTNCMEQVKSIAKILGYEQKTVNIDAKVGALDSGSLEDKLKFLVGREAKKD